MAEVTPSSEYNATVIRRVDITPRLVILQVRPDGEFSFKAGQYTTLGLLPETPRVPEADVLEPDPSKPGKLIKRAYSISSGSQTKDHMEFYISLVPSGELTPRLFTLGEGDRVFVGTSGKGMFTLDKIPVDRNILMVATGTGLAPYVSMLRTHLAGCPTQPVAVLHGAAYSWDLGYRGELEGLNARCHNLAYIPVVSRPDSDPDWRGRVGRLTDWLRRPELAQACRFDLQPETTHVLLCGNPGMIEDAQSLLEFRGFKLDSRKDPGTIHAEKYW